MLDSIEVDNSSVGTSFPSFPKSSKDIFSKAKRQVQYEERKRNLKNANKKKKISFNLTANSSSIIEEVNELNQTLVSSKDSSFLINESQSLVENWLNISQTLIKLATPKKYFQMTSENISTGFIRKQNKCKSQKVNNTLTLTTTINRNQKFCKSKR